MKKRNGRTESSDTMAGEKEKKKRRVTRRNIKKLSQPKRKNIMTNRREVRKLERKRGKRAGREIKK